MMDNNTERYSTATTLEKEYKLQLFSPLIMHGDDTEHQFNGQDIYVDYRALDIKFDFYVNDNIVVEVYNSHHKEHPEPSFMNLTDDTLICYVKHNAIYYWSPKQWRQFIYTEVYNKRKTFGVNGNGTTFKNFSINEMPKPIIVCRRIKGSMPLYENQLRHSKINEGELHSDN